MNQIIESKNAIKSNHILHHISIATNVKENLIKREESYEQIINASSPIIKKLIDSYMDFDIESSTVQEDLLQECNIHLITTVIFKYDPSKGTLFTTYLYSQIRGFLQHIFHTKYRFIPMSSYFVKEATKDDALEKHKEIFFALKKQFVPVNESKENIIDYNHFIDNNIVDKLFMDDFLKEHLSELEYKVIHFYYWGKMTHEEIGSKLNYTKQYISKVKKYALEKLNKSKNKLGGD